MANSSEDKVDAVGDVVDVPDPTHMYQSPERGEGALEGSDTESAPSREGEEVESGSANESQLTPLPVLPGASTERGPSNDSLESSEMEGRTKDATSHHSEADQPVSRERVDEHASGNGDNGSPSNTATVVEKTEGAAQDEEDPHAELRARLRRYYKVHNPIKITTINEVLKKWAHREEALFRALTAKYGPEPPEEDEESTSVVPAQPTEAKARMPATATPVPVPAGPAVTDPTMLEMIHNERGAFEKFKVPSSKSIVLSCTRLGPIRASAVVFVHPWSKLGGCSDLMAGMMRNLFRQGITSITFDCRGVGKSTGSSTWTGKSEINDVVAVCDYLSKQGMRQIVLVGSSAGAAIAGAAFPRLSSAVAYVGIGYTFGYMASWVFGGHRKALMECDKPKLFLMGGADGFTSEAQLNDAVSKMKGETRAHVFPGLAHFELERSHHAEVAERIAAFFARYVG